MDDARKLELSAKYCGGIDKYLSIPLQESSRDSRLCLRTKIKNFVASTESQVKMPLSKPKGTHLLTITYNIK